MIQCSQLPLRSFAMLYLHGKGKSAIPLAHLMSSGNHKLPRTTAIFNISAAYDCESFKRNLCAANKAGCKCYARKAEYFRLHVLEYRRRQGEFWNKTTAEEFVSQFLLLNSLKKSPYLKIRLNESGDFRNQNDIVKVEKIAMMLRRFGIRVYGYTSRKDLDFSKLHHTIISGSGFTKKGISNIFQIIGKKEKPMKGYRMCKGNCRICDRCCKRNLKTNVRIH